MLKINMEGSNDSDRDEWRDKQVSNLLDIYGEET